MKPYYKQRNRGGVRKALVIFWLLASSLGLHSDDIRTGISENRDPNVATEIFGRVHHLLENRIFQTLVIREMDFRDALERVQDDTSMVYEGPVELDRRGLSFVIEGDFPVKVSIEGTNVSMGRALDEICHQAGALWTIRNTAIHITRGTKFTQRESPYKGDLK